MTKKGGFVYMVMSFNFGHYIFISLLTAWNFTFEPLEKFKIHMNMEKLKEACRL